MAWAGREGAEEPPEPDDKLWGSRARGGGQGLNLEDLPPAELEEEESVQALEEQSGGQRNCVPEAHQGCPIGPVLGPSEERLWDWTGQVTRGSRALAGKKGGREGGRSRLGFQLWHVQLCGLMQVINLSEPHLSPL